MRESSRTCIGFIMDGNRRFAKQKNISLQESYKEGAEVLRQCFEWSHGEGFTDVVVFAFSSDNWKREDESTNALFDTFIEEAKNTDTLIKSTTINPSIRFIGDRKRFSPRMQQAFIDIEQKTSKYNDIIIWIAVSYNGREDIVRAARQCVALQEDITEKNIKKHLSTHSFPDPECIIRTGGTQRLSGFLLWESEYSELIFINTLWPALTKSDFQLVMQQFHTRTKNNGT